MHFPRFFRRKPPLSELDDELRAHLEMRAASHAAAGLPPNEARERARREFGNLALTMERTRAVNSYLWLESLAQDVRYALRTLARNRGFTLAALFTLALGIGATTAVFSVVDRTLFRPLPYNRPDLLYWTGLTVQGLLDEHLPGAWYRTWRKSPVFEKVAISSETGACTLSSAGSRDPEPSRLTCARVSESFLPMLGLSPALGRNFRPEEDGPGGAPVALLSWDLWQKRFGADPSLLGRTITADGVARTVIGVLPRTFEFPTLAPVDILTPIAFDEANESMARGTTLLRLFARLKPGISVEQARAGLAPMLESARRELPSGEIRKLVTLALVSFQERQVREIRTAYLVLLASVLCVLLIACANVANLLLARTAARRHEVAVRLAIGAGRMRLFRQWLTESAVLALAGGCCGILVSFALLKLAIATAPVGIPRLAQATLDARVLLFALAASLLTGLLFGLAPALQLRSHAILGVARRASTPARSWPRHVLVVAQLSISLVLLTGAGLLLKSLWRLERVEIGIRPEHVLVVPFRPPREMARHPERQMALYDETLRRVSCLPGMAAVAFIDSLPPIGRLATGPVTIEGRPRPAMGDMILVRAAERVASPAYFRAMGIRLLAGRFFTEHDDAAAEPVVLINEAMAKKFFPAANPIGKRIEIGEPGFAPAWRTIIGVVADIRNNGLRAPADPENIRPLAQVRIEIAPVLVVRTQLDPAAAGPLLKAELHSLNPTQPLEIQTMHQHLAEQFERPRFQTVLLAFFATIAVLLALLGIYGVMSYLVLQRTREIGIRMALGAGPAAVRRLIVGRALGLAAAGVALGLAGAWVATRALSTLLFGVRPHDAAVFSTVAFFLAAVCTLAGYLPARRASRIDPSLALRYE